MTRTAAKVRLQRVMAEAGVASRRACEELIERGLVEVNGEIVQRLPAFVDPLQDRIVVDGRPLPRSPGARSGPGGEGRSSLGAAVVGKGSRHLYVMLYKPARTLTTLRDEGGRRTVADLVQHPSGARLYPVGRLDYDTTGLVLMTNDGELANRLTHPRYGVTKTYQAEVKGEVQDGELRSIERDILRAGKRAAKADQRLGVRPVGGRAAREGVRVGLRVIKSGVLGGRGDREPQGGERGRKIVEITLAEGRNRQVETVLDRAGYSVKRLVCVGIGPLVLKGLAPGEWRELDRREARELRKAAGASRPAEGGAPSSGARPKKARPVVSPRT